MRLSDVIYAIEERIPLSWAEEWDNPGLTVGDPSASVSRIAVALDVTEDAVMTAALSGCQLLVTHHPIIFRSIKSIVADRPAMRAVTQAISSGVALYAAHTNWDSSPEGVNFCLADLLGLENMEPMIPPALDNGAWGLGVTGDFKRPLSMGACMELLKERWRLPDLSGWGDESRKIGRIAIGGGSCGAMWERALYASADLFITADMTYHHIQDALGMGLNLIITDHGGMERLSLPALRRVMEEAAGLSAVILQEVPAKRIFI